jgi:hypothetical protein
VSGVPSQRQAFSEPLWGGHLRVAAWAPGDVRGFSGTVVAQRHRASGRQLAWVLDVPTQEEGSVQPVGTRCQVFWLYHSVTSECRALYLLGTLRVVGDGGQP